MKRYILGLSGASGQIFGLRVLGGLLASGAEVHVVASPNALQMLRDECGRDWAGGTEA